MNDSGWRHPPWKPTDPFDTDFILDDCGLDTRVGERVMLAVPSGHRWYGVKGTVVTFVNDPDEPLASVDLDGDDAIIVPRRAIRRA